MKSCREIRRSFSAYLDREIDAAGRREIDDHLALCEGCRRLSVELANVDRALLAAPVPPVTPAGTEALLASLKRELSGEVEEPTPWWAALARFLLQPRVSFGLAACACAFLTVGLTMRSFGPLPGNDPRAVAQPVAPGPRAELARAPVAQEIEAKSGNDAQTSPAAPAALARTEAAAPPAKEGAGRANDPFRSVRTEIATLAEEIRRLEQEIDSFSVVARREGAARDQQLASRRVDEWR